MDNFTRESLAIEPGQRFKGEQVAEVLSRLIRERGKPESIWVDNGTELTSRAMNPVSLLESGQTGLLQARKTYGQCFYRKLQWKVSRRVLKSKLVFELTRCPR